MATFSPVYSLNTCQHSSDPSMHHHSRANPRSKLSLSCRSRFPSGPSGGSSDKESSGKKQGKRWLAELYAETAGQLGRGLKEGLMSPKQKGDWKDVVLMSLSFAVYVYISQMLVCAYCAWVSMLNHY